MKTSPFENQAFKFSLFLLILVVCFFVGRFVDVDLNYYRNILAQFPLLISGIAFVGMYVVVTFFVWFGPKDVFRVASAVLFGAVVSTVLVSIAETINAAVLFIFSRRMGKEFVEKKFRLKSQSLEKMKEQSGVIGILAIRINPLIPFRLMDLGAGLSRVSFQKYIGVALLATPLRVYWMQAIIAHVGEAFIEDPMVIVQHLNEHPFLVFYSGIYFLAVIVLSVIALIMKVVKSKKNSKLQSEE